MVGTSRIFLAGALALAGQMGLGMQAEPVVTSEHPRLLGPASRLARLAARQPQAFEHVKRVAAAQDAGDHSRMISMGLVCALEPDRELGREAVGLALKYINGPIRSGHVTFGSDLARCALVYDLCFRWWTSEERESFHQYMNRTVDANLQSESHVFHNGWYAYKHWGIGLACLATYHENRRAPEILQALLADYRDRAAPALETAGDGGGWAEGYYINYWLYEWLFFCEAARLCGGLDLYAAAPRFYRNRAVAGMFETLPGIGEYGSRRPVPMGDGGGRMFGGDRDKALYARMILANVFGDDPAHQAVHAFNRTTPTSAVGNYAFKDVLWRDPNPPVSRLADFRLSHLSPGPGYVWARSSWEEDATYFFFKCGDRFTAHQHLDVGHFYIYRHSELAGDGGHYDGFGTDHDVNYHLRTIAHSTILVRDPNETWSGIRAGRVSSNDGGQLHSWPHHNGAFSDLADWERNRELNDIGDITGFEDTGDYVYVASDCARAYSRAKLSVFTRQIVFLRPGTVVIFDRVVSERPSFRKTWLLQAAREPERRGGSLVVTNGEGRLFVQTLLPEAVDLRTVTGPELYVLDGVPYPPAKDTGPAPGCRIELVPSEPAKEDLFLHVLTATDSSVDSVPVAAARRDADLITVRIGRTEVDFTVAAVGGGVRTDSGSRVFPTHD